MLRIFSMLIYFFRELIFDSKEEYDFKSRKFNVKKVLAFMLLLVSVSVNIFLGNRVLHLAVENSSMKKILREHNIKFEKISYLSPSDRASELTILKRTDNG